MATFITVAQRALTQLLEANRRQTAANRLGLAKQAKAVAMPAPAPVRINPSRRVTLASEQLAANRRGGVLLLLHFDGTAFVDNGRYRLPITVAGDAVLSTAQSRFGGSSGFFNGRFVEAESASTGGNLSLASPQLQLNDDDFTVEFWLFPDSDDGGQFDQPLYVFPDAGNGGIWGQSHGSGYQLSWIVGDPADNVYSELDEYLTYDQWHHLAFVRTAGVMHTFVNGVKQTGDYATVAQPALSSVQLRLGSTTFGDGSQRFLRAYLDELRSVKGKAVYTDNFTPPTGPFSNRQP